MKVLQWNSRSIFSALTDLFYLSHQLNPNVILLQETWLSPGKTFHLKGFRSFRLDRNARGGGLLILVSNKIFHKANLSFKFMDSDCEILAIDLCLPGYQPFSIINTYFPTGVQSTRQLDRAVAACRKEILFAGDFNSHHVSWGLKTDLCGKRLWEWAIDSNLSCQNTGHVTFVRGHFRSVLDLTFCSAGLNVSSWLTVDSATNSDHLPVSFEIMCPITSLECQACTFVNHNKFKTVLLPSVSNLPMPMTRKSLQ